MLDCKIDSSPLSSLSSLRWYGRGAAPITPRERASQIVRGIQEKQGSFHKDPSSSAILDNALVDAFSEILCLWPIVVKNPAPGVRYVVIGQQCAALYEDGRIRLGHRSWQNAAPLYSGSTASPWRWCRAGLPDVVECSAEVETVALRAVSSCNDGYDLSFSEHLFSRLKSSASAKKAPGFDNPSIRHHLARHSPVVSFSAGSEDVNQASYIAVGLAEKYSRTTSRLFAHTILRLANSRLVTLSARIPVNSRKLRFHSQDVFFKWYATSPSPEVLTRRVQFSEAYPHLVPALFNASFGKQVMESSVSPNITLSENASLASELLHAVDHEKPVAVIARELMGLPKWLDNNLRGILHVESAFTSVFMGAYCGMLWPALKILEDLGPSWRLRKGYHRFAGTMLMATVLNDFDAEFLRRSVPRGGGDNPWGALLRLCPLEWRKRFRSQELKNEVINHLNADLRDTFSTLRRDVFSPLLGEGYFFGGGHFSNFGFSGVNEGLSMSLASKSWSLPRLLKFSDDYHARTNAILGARFNIDLQEGHDIVSWDSLFPPFEDDASGLTLSCITDDSSLRTHGLVMGHCVGGYSLSCLEGECHIVQIVSKGRPIATAELRIVGATPSGAHNGSTKAPARCDLIQVRGRKNGQVTRAVTGAVEKVVAQLDRWLAACSTDREARFPNSRGFLSIRELRAGLKSREKAIEIYKRRYNLTSSTKQDPQTTARLMDAWFYALPSPMKAIWSAPEPLSVRLTRASAWLRKQAGSPAIPVSKKLPRDNGNTLRAA